MKRDLSNSGLLFAAFACAGCAAAPDRAAPPVLMTPADLQALSHRVPDVRVRYGSEPSQFGELRVPAGEGPFPVVALIHGGCFRKEFADLDDLSPMADKLEDLGIATWNVEYRRLGEPGAGWPGTYRDIGAAMDKIRELAPEHRLDLSRVAILGHSAGAHLAHWAAARAKVAPDSAIFSDDPLPVRGVVNLAGRADMSAAIAEYDAACGGPVIEQMLGGSLEQNPLAYRAASPSALLPLGVRQVMIWGEHEPFVPALLVEDYVAKARQSGDDVRLLVVPGAGHFETASPETAAWPTVLGALRDLLGIGNR